MQSNKQPGKLGYSSYLFNSSFGGILSLWGRADGRQTKANFPTKSTLIWFPQPLAVYSTTSTEAGTRLNLGDLLRSSRAFCAMMRHRHSPRRLERKGTSSPLQVLQGSQGKGDPSIPTKFGDKWQMNLNEASYCGSISFIYWFIDYLHVVVWSIKV